jgi:beta-lactamase regulating signal transducer with metallopeptidase domain/uncharacterized GH25 family protein
MNTFFQFLSSDSTARLITALLHTLWQGTLIAGILYIFLRRTPAGHAQTRYAFATLALAGIVLAGLMTWAWLDLDKKVLVPSLTTTVVKTIPAKAIQSPTVSLSEQYTPQEPLTSTIPWTSWAAGVWFAGVAVMFLRTLSHLLGAGRLRREASQTEDQTILNMVDHLRRLMNITQRVRVCISDHIATPAVLGVLWPIILVPASMLSGIPADQLRATLAHELAHIRRYDYLVNLIQMFVEILFFFNPAVWWISRQIRAEREACCDRIAVTITGEKIVYIQTLADWVRKLRPLPATLPAFADAGPPSKILDRVKRLLTPHHRPALRLSWPAMILTLLAAAVLLITLRQGIFTAVKILSPQERIAKIEQIKQEYTEPESVLGSPKQPTLTVSGTVETSDHKPLPTDLRLSPIISRSRWSSIYSMDINNGKFTDNHFPAGQIYFQTWGSDYAPSVTGPIEGKPGTILKDIKLVLERGFPALIKITDPNGKPVPRANISGGYKIIPNSYSWTINMNTDEKGLIRFQDTGKFPIAYTLTASGFQKQTGELRLNPDHPSVLIMEPTKPITVTITSQKTGKPIPNAEVRLLMESNPSESTQNVPDFSQPLAKTDSVGRFTLNTLRDDTVYYFLIEASGYSPVFLAQIGTGQKSLKIALGPQRLLHGKILTDLDKHGKYIGPRTISYHKSTQVVPYTYQTSSTKELSVTVRNGTGYFEINDLWPGELQITANKREFTFKIDQPETQVVIDLREVPQNQKTRDVVFHFEFPPDLPSPAGKLRVKYTLDHRQSWREKIIPIQKKDAGLPLPVLCEIEYDAIDPVGCWIKGEWNFQVPLGKEPFTLVIPVSAAGTIYGRVLNSRGNLASKADISVTVIDKSPQMESTYLHLSPRVNELDGKFMVAPLPFGGTYAVIAALPSENSWTVSRPIHIDATHPISKIEMTFPEGKEISGQVLDPNGNPAPKINLSLKIDFSFTTNTFVGSGGPKIQTDAAGRFTFKHVNPDIPGEYTLNFDSRKEYQPLDIKVKPGGWWPLTIHLLPGKSLTGVVVDHATGYPVPGVRVRASANDSDWTRPAAQVEAEAFTDALGRFQFSNMADREYSFCPQVGEMPNYPSPPILGRPGQKEPVILSIDLPPGSTQKPNTSAPKIKWAGPGS